jgi:hypothetical protein
MRSHKQSMAFGDAEIVMQDQPDNAIHLTTRAAWRAWLAQHHTRPEGVRLISSKKATG